MRLSLEKREVSDDNEDSDNEDGYYDETEIDNVEIDNMVDVLFEESDDEDED